mmetsp:Transcript_61587/g.155542  ORF Transcript_61587/g.155542 Transcript_61587/m.155542 type:complete len:259 (+) Transcript_61587:81-857(+)
MVVDSYGGAATPAALASALIGAVDHARSEAVACLTEEIRRCTNLRQGSAEAVGLETRCQELLRDLREQGALRAARFERLVLEHLLRVPNDTFGEELPLRPAELIAPLAALEIFDDSKRPATIQARAVGDLAGECELPRESVEIDDDKEVTEALDALAASIRRGRRLRDDAEALEERVQLFQSAAQIVEAGGGDSGPRAIVGQLQELMEKAAKMGDDGFSQKRPLAPPAHSDPSESPKRMRAASAAEARAAARARSLCF